MRFYRPIAILALICGLGTFASFDALGAARGAEVVRNDFERNYDGWYGNGGRVTLTAADGAGVDGSRGMLVSGRAGARDGAASSKGLYLKGGVSYEYSVQVYCDAPEKFRFELLCGAGRFGAPPTAITIAAQDVEPGKWTTLSGTCAAPERAADFILSIATDSANDFRFDDLRVVGEAPAELQDAAAEKGLKDYFNGSFRVGNILNGRTINNRAIAATILKDCNSVECENETKPDSTLSRSLSHGTEVGVTLRAAAAIFDFCVRNNLPVRGHTLVWHSQTPGWFFKENFDDRGEWVDPATMDARMESYIKNMFGAIAEQYPDLKLYAYDVCNEAISDDFRRVKEFDGAREPGDNNAEHGKSAWVRVYGDNSFVEKAFVYARKYAPEGCLLYYNDYNEYMEHKRDCIYKLCKSLYEKGLLDGVGMQTHVRANVDGFGGVDAWRVAMEKYLSIGCSVMVTEMDVSLDKGKFSLEDQAAKYAAIFKAARDWNAAHEGNNRVLALCVWGPNDANSWLGEGSDGLLYDRQNAPKPAYDALTALAGAKDGN